MTCLMPYDIRYPAKQMTGTNNDKDVVFMYALVEIKGKQYKALEGAQLTVDRFDKEPGDVLEFESVLMISDGDAAEVGNPYVKGAKVTAVVNEQIKGKKITILKFKRRKGYRKKQGHRQKYSVLTVQGIQAK